MQYPVFCVSTACCSRRLPCLLRSWYGFLKKGDCILLLCAFHQFPMSGFTAVRLSAVSLGSWFYGALVSCIWCYCCGCLFATSFFVLQCMKNLRFFASSLFTTFCGCCHCNVSFDSFFCAWRYCGVLLCSLPEFVLGTVFLRFLRLALLCHLQSARTGANAIRFYSPRLGYPLCTVQLPRYCTYFCDVRHFSGLWKYSC